MIVSDNFEVEVLTYLFRTPERMAYYHTQLEEVHFKDPVHAGLWVLFQEQFEKYRELNYAALVEAAGARMNPGPAQLFTAEEGTHLADLIELITDDRHVLTEWVEERLVEWLSSRRVDLYHADNTSAILDGNYDEVHGNYRQLVADEALAAEDDEVDLFTIMPQIAETIAEDRSREITTGLTGFNTILGGGLYRGEFGIFWGPPEIGKSMMVVQVGASAVMGGARVLHISTEMDERQVQQRYVAHFTRIDKYDLGIPVNGERVQAWQDTHGAQYKGLLTIKYVQQGTTIDELWTIINSASVRGKPYHLVIIDYVDKLGCAKSKDIADWLRLEKIFEQLQDLCKIGGPMGTDTCIFAVTHANAAVEDKAYAGHKSLVRSKDGKWKVVDFSIFMGATPEDRKDGRIILSCMKLRNRTTAIKTCAFYTDYGQARFTEDREYTRKDD